jgi:hypothetical protein
MILTLSLSNETNAFGELFSRFGGSRNTRNEAETKSILLDSQPYLDSL